MFDIKCPHCKIGQLVPISIGEVVYCKWVCVSCGSILSPNASYPNYKPRWVNKTGTTQEFKEIENVLES
jgi:transcription initiation factor TFIIIB Brf1 subunit/transcription initiation factor TFIIB